MSLLIWLGPYFQAKSKTLGHTFRQLAGLFLPFFTFLGPLGGAQIPPNSIIKIFLVVLDRFSYKKGPIDLVIGLFLSYDIGPYIPTTCGPFNTFLGPFRGAQMPQNTMKNFFLVVFYHFFYKNGLIDLVRPSFSS
jgi:hypothetical protein